MQDVFEPMNFAGEVFEPTANFGGEVFEPMNFDGEYSNFGILKKKTPEQLAVEKKQKEDKAKAKEKSDKAKADAKANKKPTDWSGLLDKGTSLIKTATDTVTQLAPAFQKPEFQKNLEAYCGKKGTVLGLGKPRQSYLDCAKDFMSKQGVSNTQFEEWKDNLDKDNGGSDDKSTGMSLGAKIGITAGVLAVIGVGVYFILKGGKK